MDEKVTLPSRGTPLSPRAAMELALEQARRGAPFVSPNPQVGCVILSATGGFLSAGFHERYGGPHAEPHALGSLTDDELRGARVFVTLEPCAHEGKTPSCAKHLARLPVAEVVFGLVDPNPLVSGKGARILTEAGKRCVLYRDAHGLELEDAFEEVAEVFLWNTRHRKPFIALKAAISLDGRMATGSGRSQWITGPESRREVHRIRAALDGVLVGVGTFLADDPSLDIRDLGFEKENFAVVMDPHGRSLERLANSKLFRARSPAKIVIAVSSGVEASLRPAAHSLGIQLLNLEQDSRGGLSMPGLLSGLWDLGLRSVLVEGGPFTNQAFLAAEAVQRVHLFQAPILLGGEGSYGWTGGLRVEDLGQAPELRRLRGLDLGRDHYRTGLLQDPVSGASFRNV